MRLWYFALAVVAFACLAFGPAACQRPQQEPRGSNSAAVVDHRVAIAFAAARTGLEVLDAAEVLYLDSGTKLKAFHGEDDPALIASGKRIEKLQAVRVVLEQVRQRLADGAKPDLRQVLADLESGLAAAKAAGVNVPPAVATSLQTLREFLP